MISKLILIFLAGRTGPSSLLYRGSGTHWIYIFPFLINDSLSSELLFKLNHLNICFYQIENPATTPDVSTSQWSVRGHKRSITAIALSHDGLWLYSASKDFSLVKCAFCASSNLKSLRHLPSYSHVILYKYIYVSSNRKLIILIRIENIILEWPTCRGPHSQTPRVHRRGRLLVATRRRSWRRRRHRRARAGGREGQKEESEGCGDAHRPPRECARARALLRRAPARLRRRARAHHPLGRRRARAPARVPPLPRPRQQEAQTAGRRHRMLFIYTIIHRTCTH